MWYAFLSNLWSTSQTNISIKRRECLFIVLLYASPPITFRWIRSCNSSESPCECWSSIISHPEKKSYTSIRTLSTPLKPLAKNSISQRPIHKKIPINTKKNVYTQFEDGSEDKCVLVAVRYIFDLVDSQHDFLWTILECHSRTYNTTKLIN